MCRTGLAAPGFNCAGARLANDAGNQDFLQGIGDHGFLAEDAAGSAEQHIIMDAPDGTASRAMLPGGVRYQ